MITLEQAIQQRHSVRTYRPEMPSADIMTRLQARINGPLSVYCGGSARIVLIQRALDGNIGTYGVIRGAQCYLALIYKPATPADHINAGMAMEQQVMWLTQQGLGTCWLAGTFKRGNVARSVPMADGEVIAALLPLGIAADHESLTSRLMKRLAHSARRKPFDELFDIPAMSPFRKALQLMRLAPSAVNRQPWRATVTGADPCTVHFYTTPGNDDTLLNLGIGLAHFMVAAPAGTFVDCHDAAPARGDARYVISYRAGSPV